MFWLWILGALFTCFTVEAGRQPSLIVLPRSLQYSVFYSNGCLMWLVECRRWKPSVMQLRRLVPSKDSVENSEVILFSPQTIISRDITVAPETMPWDPSSFILEHLSTDRTEFSYSVSISSQTDLTFSTASGIVLGGGDCPFLCTEKR